MAESADLQEGLQPSSAVACGAVLSSLLQEPVSAAVGSAGRRHVVSPASSPGAVSPHSSSSGSGATPSSRRVCASSGCRRVLGGINIDPHTVCILCRGGVCQVNSRCRECSPWSSKLVLRAFKYQRTLQKRCEYKAKKKTLRSSCQSHGDVGGGSLLPASPSSRISGSACGSVESEDSVSQFPVPSVVPPFDMSAFLKGFAAFLGFSEGSQCFLSFHVI